VGEMVKPFEKLVEEIAKLTHTMTVDQAVHDCDEWATNLFDQDLETTMFPIVGDLEEEFSVNDSYYDHSIRCMEQTQLLVVPPLIAFAMGKPWVSPVEQ
jgi:hypothetical protein